MRRDQAPRGGDRVVHDLREVRQRRRDLDWRDNTYPRIVFGAELTDARWEDGRWRITGDGVEDEADFIITGCGFLHRPSTPDIPGLESFAGPAFHSSQWDHSVDLSAKRVGIVGTGSTGVQIVTGLAGRADHVTQFTRTPQWVYPTPNRRYLRLTRAAYRRFPRLNDLAYRGYQRAYESCIFPGLVADGWQRRLLAAGCRLNLLTVRDRALRARLTPSHQTGCKRLIVSTGYYRAVQRADVEVVTDRIERITPAGVVTADGVVHELDVLVLATGFDTHALVRPMEFVGPDGRRLSDAWADGPRGYGTVAVPGLPNLFMVMGPNSPVNVSSMVNVAEAQVAYAVQMIERWRAQEDAPALAPTQAAADRFTGELQAAMPGTVWVTGCSSWYLGEDGTPEIWPWLPARHRDMLAEPEPADYEALA